MKPAKEKQKIFLMPVAGRTFTDPATMHDLPDHGEWKVLTPFVRRRLNDGDVREGTADEAAASVTAIADAKAARQAEAAAEKAKDKTTAAQEQLKTAKAGRAEAKADSKAATQPAKE